MYMGSDAVAWQDYEGIEGFGPDAGELHGQLMKALSAGHDIINPGAVAGSGYALRVESLERTLRSTTFGFKAIRLWRLLSKIPAYNTVEQMNLVLDYGDGIEGFIDEGDLPEESDSTYERKTLEIKYLGTTRRVKHPMLLIRGAHGSVVGNETSNGTKHVLRMMERALIYGNSNLSSLQFDGFMQQIIDNSPSANIVDKKGAALTEDNLNDGALTVSSEPNYGNPTHLLLNPKNHGDIVKTFFPKERIDVFSQKDGMVGLNIRGWMSPAGGVLFEPDTFVGPGQANGGDGSPFASGYGDTTKRPSAPTISTAISAAAGGTASVFEAGDAGNYRYKVVAANRYGRSAPVTVDASALAIAAGQKATFGVTEGSIPAGWWEVYRTEAGGALGTEKLILRIARTGATQTLEDYNAWRPGTTIAILFQMDEEAVAFKQLAPLLRVPLSIEDTSLRWMMLLYGSPWLYTPGKIMMFKNIGRDPGYVGTP